MNRFSISRAKEILARIPEVRILVVGDLMLDRYLKGSVDRISPEAPVPVVRVEAESWALGGAGNVAANIVGLGAACEVIGCVGRDPEGEILLDMLRELGVGVSGISRLNRRPTTVKTRIMARHQHVTRVDREDPSDIHPSEGTVLAQAIRDSVGEVHGIALEDYNKGVFIPSVIRQAMAGGTSAGVPVVVDPKRMRFFEFQGATVFKPNARELEDAVGEPLQPDDSVWMENVRQKLQCETLLVTLGERGMAVQASKAGHMHIPTAARDVYDVSGAGDTVTAVLTAALAVDATPFEAAILANHAAAVEVGKAGVATVSPKEILKQQTSFIDEDRE